MRPRRPFIARVAGDDFCAACVKEYGFSRCHAYSCKACGGRCEDLRRTRDAAESVMTCPETLGRRLAVALFYPFQGNGPYLLLGGTAFFSLFRMVFLFPLLGARMWVLLLPFIACYLVICLITIIRANAYGESDPPNWRMGWIGGNGG